jgi:hypothetical protein
MRRKLDIATALIHNPTLIKIDCIIRKKTAFDAGAFSRKKVVMLEGTPVCLITPEDLILAKLRWCRDSLSELQIRDKRCTGKTFSALGIVF